MKAAPAFDISVWQLLAGLLCGARIEIAEVEMDKALDKALLDRIKNRFSEIGFRFVTLDLAGFRSGSLNP